MRSHEMPDEREVAQARWTAYALGQLDGGELAAAEREVAGDADAARFVEEIRALAGHVRAARQAEPLPAASSGLQQRIVEALEDKEVAMSMPNRVQSGCLAYGRHRRRSLWATAAASFVAGGLVIGLILPAVRSPNLGSFSGATAGMPSSADARPDRPTMAPSTGSKENTQIQSDTNAAKPKEPAVAATNGPGAPDRNAYPRMVPPLTGDAAAYPSARSSTVAPPTVPAEEAMTGRFMFSVGGVNSDAGLMGSIVVDEKNFDWQYSPARLDDVRSGKAWRGDGQRFRVETNGAGDAPVRNYGFGIASGGFYSSYALPDESSKFVFPYSPAQQDLGRFQTPLYKTNYTSGTSYLVDNAYYDQAPVVAKEEHSHSLCTPLDVGTLTTPPGSSPPVFEHAYSGGYIAIRGFDFRGAAEERGRGPANTDAFSFSLGFERGAPQGTSSDGQTASASRGGGNAQRVDLFGYSQLGVSTIRGEQLPGVRQYDYSNGSAAGTVIRDNNGLTASASSAGGRWVNSGLSLGKPVYEWQSNEANQGGNGKYTADWDVDVNAEFRHPRFVSAGEQLNRLAESSGAGIGRDITSLTTMVDPRMRITDPEEPRIQASQNWYADTRARALHHPRSDASGGQHALLGSLYAVESSRVALNDNEPICYPEAGTWPSVGEPVYNVGKPVYYTPCKPVFCTPRQVQWPGVEQYAPIIENRFLAPFAVPLSTFSIDVDTASYANVRRFLDNGQLPPPDAVRVEEMVNYFSYDYPKPEGDEPFSVGFELADCPWKAGHQLLRVGLKGREVKRTRRGASNLVFLLDVSGSMGEENKLSLVKQAMRLLVDQLGEGDRVAIVTYATEPAVRLESTNGENKEKILKAIDSLAAEGWTNGSGGIELAYDEAAKHFEREGDNRIILATDGDLNVGVTKDEDLVRLIKKKAKSGVFLTVLGFGQGNLKDSKLEKLADCGNGAYAYVDSLREARKVLVEQLTGSLYTIAKDVKIQIEFNPGRVAAYRLIGYENRALRARDFNNDRKDAGEIGAGHTVTALYELVPAKTDDEDAAAATGPALKYQKIVRPASTLTDAADSDELATVRLRYKEPDGKKSRLIARVVGSRGTSFSAASGDFQFASAVAAFGMILRGSPYAGDATLAAVEQYATPGLSNDAKGHRAEFVDLVRKTRQLKDSLATAAKRSWGPEQATGVPDTHRAGDSPTAWASQGADSGIEWLQVEFDRAVPIAEVRIRENDCPGAVSRVVAVVDGGEHELWVGQDPTTTAPTDFVVHVEGDVTSRTIRIYLDTSRKPGWNEIDAVELVCTDGSRQWASRATASSSYADG